MQVADDKESMQRFAAQAARTSTPAVRRNALGLTGLGVGLVLCAALLTQGCGRFGFEDSPSIRFKTNYQAVFVDNGQVFFGKIEQLDRHYVVLGDVFYVKTVNVKGANGKGEESEQVRSVLVKRGKEWHGPDFMAINANHVLLIEPVGEDSKVAQLIHEQTIP